VEGALIEASLEALEIGARGGAGWCPSTGGDPPAGGGRGGGVGRRSGGRIGRCPGRRPPSNSIHKAGGRKQARVLPEKLPDGTRVVNRGSDPSRKNEKQHQDPAQSTRPAIADRNFRQPQVVSPAHFGQKNGRWIYRRRFHFRQHGQNRVHLQAEGSSIGCHETAYKGAWWKGGEFVPLDRFEVSPLNAGLPGNVVQ
jgi:hypothetical protein